MQLVINTFGTSLRRKGDRFVVKSSARQTPVEISAHKIQSLVIATGAHFSSNVIQLAAEHNIDVVFLDKLGRPIARVWQTKMGSTAAIRRRQLEAAETDEAMQFVRGWTTSKIDNQLGFLRELQARRPEHAEAFTGPLGTIQECREKVAACTGAVDEQRHTLMGLEGAAGRAYFQCLSPLMPQEYRFHGRSRQPAVDAFNAMLNYSYGVLYSQVERALILAGLDPFVGFLHTDDYNKRSLVFRHDRAVPDPGRPHDRVVLYRPAREAGILPRGTRRCGVESRGPRRLDDQVQRTPGPDGAIPGPERQEREEVPQDPPTDGDSIRSSRAG